MSASLDDNGTFVGPFDFKYPILSEVNYGDGRLATETPRHLHNWKISHAIVVANRSLTDTEDLASLMAALNEQGIQALLFTGAMQHCPFDLAADLAGLAREHGAGAIVAVGGSSVSDMAKAANLLATFSGARSARDVSELRERIDPGVPLRWPLISIPTTLSGGEFTPIVGISDRRSGHKAVLRHPALCSNVIVLDPALQRHTPDHLWASTGFKLLDHAVERIVARNHRPLIDAQCLYGARLLLSLLEASLGGTAKAQEARARLLQVLWIIQSAHGNVGTGLSHALAHQLGSAYGLDHGCGSAICLPAALRLLSSSGRIEASRLTLLAQIFGVQPGPQAIDRILQAMEVLRRGLGLPADLPDAGILSIDAADVARSVFADPTTQSSPGHPLTASEVEGLLNTIARTGKKHA